MQTQANPVLRGIPGPSSEAVPKLSALTRFFQHGPRCCFPGEFRSWPLMWSDPRDVRKPFLVARETKPQAHRKTKMPPITPKHWAKTAPGVMRHSLILIESCAVEGIPTHLGGSGFRPTGSQKPGLVGMYAPGPPIGHPWALGVYGTITALDDGSRRFQIARTHTQLHSIV